MQPAVLFALNLVHLSQFEPISLILCFETVLICIIVSKSHEMTGCYGTRIAVRITL
jgi:hypothetical protein